MSETTTDDRTQILDVLHRYCRGIDRLDEDLVRSCYHPDGVANHGLYEGSVDHFMSSAFRRQRADVQTAAHTLHQSLIEVEGDAAVAETYATAVERRRPEPNGTVDTLVGLRYVDRFERRDGSWLIARRTVVVDWTQVREVDEGPLAEADFVRGRRDDQDAVYAELARLRTR